MHPQIRQTRPGNCPICGMKLIPVEEEGPSEGPRVFTASEAARELMDIETQSVERRFVAAEIRMVGKVDYDETRLAYITAWVPGRLDRLFVDYTGVPVRKGDHMVYMYSPELLSAQEELLQAIQAVKNLRASGVTIVREATEATVATARAKLRLLGLTAEQVAEIERRGTASDHVTIFAPAGGIVVNKNALEGMYVDTGTRIYTIADLSQVWVKLDAYEADLAWVRYGQPVEFTSVSYPGEVFQGTVAFLDPVLDDATRTVKVRVNAANAAGKLKPGMFVRAVVRAQVAAGGRVMDASLAGKWICPMHPDVIKPGPAPCDICGMPLVRTESLGYVTVEPSEADKPLVIPATAPLVTGTRAVVYVEVPGRERPTFEGRVIELGPRAGQWYLVRQGLKEGERVVVRGNFKIDSSLQIQARPSMMSPEGGAPPPGHVHGPPPAGPPAPVAQGDSPRRAAAPKPLPAAFREALAKVFAGYLAMQAALAADRLDAAVQAAGTARAAAKVAHGAPLAPEDQAAWHAASAALDGILGRAAEAKTIEAVREAFALASEELMVLAQRWGAPTAQPIVVLRCPMAFSGRGAIWLQHGRQVRNPYFGAAMPLCGDVEETIPAAPGAEP
jgi:Cu(I)/Ag(I) efflux system membrane fusion protein